MSTPIDLPVFADRVLVPLTSIAAAFCVAGLVVFAIGENPFTALKALLVGSLGSMEGVSFTLYYATNFIFTGLAVAVAFHAGLFNIGGEGQATCAGIGATLACLYLPLPWFLVLPAGLVGAVIFGALWGFVPGYLQAKRGSHVVITTIMFNFMASILLVYLLVNVIGKAGSMAPETELFPAQSKIPYIHELLAGLGIGIAKSPLNLSFVLALMSVLGTWFLLYRSRLGYAIRTLGANASAATYAGLSPDRLTILVMVLSGGLASGLAINEIMGVQSRLILEFSSGYGFVGIAVALMGRAHPVGVMLAALLFGVLYQGGAELAFESPKITRDMVTVIGGIIILFAGALDGLFRRLVAKAVARLGRPLSQIVPAGKEV